MNYVDGGKVEWSILSGGMSTRIDGKKIIKGARAGRDHQMYCRLEGPRVLPYVAVGPSRFGFSTAVSRLSYLRAENASPPSLVAYAFLPPACI